MQENHYRFALGKSLCLSFIFIFSFFTSVFAQEKIGRPLINSYGYQDYGADPLNWWALEADDGIMYFANIDGVLQFDGVNWKLIETPGIGTRSLVKDDKGIIYVGGSGQLGYLTTLDNGEMSYESLNDKIPKEHAVFADVWEIDYFKGRVIFRTEFKLYCWDGEIYESDNIGEWFACGRYCQR